MEFARPPRPRRGAVPPAVSANAFDPVGAVARIWAGLEADAPNGLPSGGIRHRSTSRSLSRPRSQEPQGSMCPKSESKSDLEDITLLREELRTETAEVKRAREAATNLRDELEHARSEIDSAPGQQQVVEEQRSQLGVHFHEELVHRLSQQSAELQEHFRECMAAEVAEELAKAKKVWNATSSADAAKERLQQEEFQRLLEAKFTADAKEELVEVKAQLAQEFAQQEENIMTSCRREANTELEQKTSSIEKDESARMAEISRSEALCKEEAEVASEQKLQQQAKTHQNDVLRLEDMIEKQMRMKAELEIHEVEESLEARTIERLECEAVAAASRARSEAESLVKHLEDREAQARQGFLNELDSHQAECDNASRRCSKLEELMAHQKSSAEKELNQKLDDHLATERLLLEEKFETRVEAHLEDCWEAATKREHEAETSIRAEMQMELEKDKESQVARLQKLMEKKLAEGLSRQKAKNDEASMESSDDVVEALAKRESEVARLQEELAEARRQKRTIGGGSEDFQSEELQKLLKMAHGENSDLRETIRDLKGEINTQAGEIALLEEKVLGTLSGLREGGREPKRSLASAVDGPPRASSMPSKSREPSNTPPSRAQPGDIRRLPPQPKQRLASNVL